MRMPPLPTDFIFPEACKPICEKLLTLPFPKGAFMISLAAVFLLTGRENGSVSHTSHKHKTGVQLFGSSEGCTPALFIILR